MHAKKGSGPLLPGDPVCPDSSDQLGCNLTFQGIGIQFLLEKSQTAWQNLKHLTFPATSLSLFKMESEEEKWEHKWSPKNIAYQARSSAVFSVFMWWAGDCYCRVRLGHIERPPCISKTLLLWNSGWEWKSNLSLPPLLSLFVCACVCVHLYYCQ